MGSENFNPQAKSAYEALNKPENKGGILGGSGLEGARDYEQSMLGLIKKLEDKLPLYQEGFSNEDKEQVVALTREYDQKLDKLTQQEGDNEARKREIMAKYWIALQDIVHNGTESSLIETRAAESVLVQPKSPEDLKKVEEYLGILVNMKNDSKKADLEGFLAKVNDNIDYLQAEQGPLELARNLERVNRFIEENLQSNSTFMVALKERGNDKSDIYLASLEKMSRKG